MATRLLTECFELSGEWHLPEQPDRKIAGRLNYGNQPSLLTLHDAFELSRSQNNQEALPRYPVIYGVTTSGEAVTVLNGNRTFRGFSFGSGGFRQPETIIADKFVVGGHLPVNHHYPSMEFRIPALEVWLTTTSIESNFDVAERRQTYSVAPQEVTEFHVPTIDATIRIATEIETLGRNPYKSVKVDVHAWIKFTPSSPKELH